MRLVGPNCLGILNTARARAASTRPSRPATPPPGNVGFVTQSGALGPGADRPRRATAAWASPRSPRSATAPTSPPTTSSSTGRSDDATRVALLYIESFSDPRRFSRVARRVGREMPIVVVKSGRSAAGERATSSHTGALLAASDVTVDALFEQAGVIRTGQPRGAARRRLAAREPAAAERPPGRDRHQRGRARDHVRGRLRGGRARGSRAARRRAGLAGASSFPPRPGCSTRST